VEDEAPPKGWFDVKYNLGMEFPNLPYLFDGDLKISETLAIIRYLANKYDKSLLGYSVED
jgi:glutathione S-transferase